MYKDIRKLYGKKLGASDGDIGHVKDLYFDDMTWAVRYLVADTSTWLSGREVLLSPHAFGAHAFRKSDEEDDALRVNLTRRQIEDSPSIETQLPVPRQYEEEYHRYYGWPMYWQGGGTWGVEGIQIVTPPSASQPVAASDDTQREDAHLRSTKSMIGYRIQATDGAIGTVSSFTLDGRSWVIRELVVETGPWYAGKEILILPENIDRISYEESTVFVNLTKEDIQQTTRDDVAQPGTAHH